MMSSKESKISVKHFLNKRGNSLKMYYPKGVKNAFLCDSFPVYIQIIYKRKVNSKKSLFYKFINKTFSNYFPDEYVSEDGNLQNLREFYDKALKLEEENTIFTIELAKNIDSNKLTLSSFAFIHEVSTKSVLEYFNRYFKDPHKLGWLLLPYNLENLPLYLDYTKDYIELCEQLKKIVEKLPPAPNSYFNNELEKYSSTYIYLLSEINNLWDTYLTPVIWERMRFYDDLITRELPENVDKDKYLMCLKDINDECIRDIEKIKKEFL